jgi:hypothetical protein
MGHPALRKMMEHEGIKSATVVVKVDGQLPPDGSSKAGSSINLAGFPGFDCLGMTSFI